jgi:hypothetical protein
MRRTFSSFFAGWMALLASACGSDVLLGGAPADGSVDVGDAALTPFPEGDFQMTVSSASTIVCMNGWVGMESAFSGVTLASLGIVDGVVTVAAADATHVVMSGAPIETGLRVSSVPLEKAGGGEVPPQIWAGVGTRAENGPLSSTLIAIEIEADETTVEATGFDGRVSAWYIDLATDGTQCLVGFATHFERL